MTIKILILAPSRRGATETFIRDSVEHLPFKSNAYFGDEYFSLDFFCLIYGLSVLLSKALTRLGFLRLASIPSSVVAVFLVLKYRPDVIMVEFGFHAVRVMEVVRLGVPLMVQFHGADASADRYLIKLRERYCRLMKLASGIVVKNSVMRERLVSLGASPEKIIISPSCPDKKLFTGSSPQESSPHFLAVGRFVDKKSPLDTLEAFARMRSFSDRYQSSTLKMIGGGPLLEAVKRRVFELQLEDVVSLPGVLAPLQVVESMRQARAFVQHSRRAQDGDEEGCPVAVIEAQLCGLPVVSTLHGGIPDVILDGETGILVEEGDIFAMASAMAELFDNPSLAAQLGTAGQLRARKNFTLDCHINQISSLISRLALTFFLCCVPSMAF